MSGNADTEPKDMGVMRGILKEMGVIDHEPAVLHHLMEFTYKYVTGVLEDAKVYSEHASKDEVADLFSHSRRMYFFLGFLRDR